MFNTFAVRILGKVGRFRAIEASENMFQQSKTYYQLFKHFRGGNKFSLFKCVSLFNEDGRAGRTSKLNITDLSSMVFGSFYSKINRRNLNFAEDLAIS